MSSMRHCRLFLLGLGMTFAGSAYSQQADEWDDWDDEPAEQSSLVSGFIELGAGRRLQTDPVLGSDTTLADFRLQAQWDLSLDNSTIKTRTDIYYDGVKGNFELQLRELAWQGSLAGLGEWAKRWDAKIGQQVLTWGVGDYLFLNDLFPKDFQSFFSGRDDEYLKAPSLSAKLSGYLDWFNLDLVVTPRFTPDTYINGEYFSFYSPVLGQNIAPEFSVSGENEPDDAEYALRAYKSIGSTEIAIYGYSGHSKSPSAADLQGAPRFYPLNAYGASVVTPLSAGLFKAEYVYQNSLQDHSGTDANIPNSQSRLLLGYEQELVANLTGSLQWYMEKIHQYEAAQQANNLAREMADEYRRVLTTQLVYRGLQQTMTLRWFNFYSPSDDDGYMRVKASYSPVDSWSVSAGLNWFYGDQKDTFFAQFKDATNVYATYRYFY
ncbi:hypothetical protein [Aliiglaciecola sp. LCG003]|uniref:hypothetical protein n=1 Tax=Aliiglaciecola sp. LCG003 TaxID=3053655 RepID=UPI0025743869|nr:hypothetical protein [Aliiglaciecola sp. LCG003]WJG10792.1 hypothetical protein QR722_07075 [Aliiglaciecola sp. LCG003]